MSFAQPPKGRWKAFIALKRWIKSRYHGMTMRRVDREPLKVRPGEILLFCTARNEAIRLPWFLDYYRELGVDRFFMIDNDSTDNSLEILAGRPNVHVWTTKDSYKNSRMGTLWRQELMRKYAQNHWCLIVDADEMFIYDGCDNKTLPELCGELEAEASLGMRALWVQMYSDKPVRETVWKQETDPFELCPFFDADCSEEKPHPHVLDWTYTLNKAPLLFHCQGGPTTGVGQHFFTWYGDERVSPSRAAVLHFKYTADLVQRCEEERKRREHAMSEEKYDGFLRRLTDEHEICLKYEGSKRLVNPADLKELGIDNDAARR